MTKQTETKWKERYQEKVNELARLTYPEDFTEENGYATKVYEFGYKRIIGDDIYTITDFGNIKKFINQAILTAKQEERKRILERVSKMQEPTEDDPETYLYRHCADGDHWKCGGDGESGRCVCRCHALDAVKSIIKDDL